MPSKDFQGKSAPHWQTRKSEGASDRPDHAEKHSHRAVFAAIEAVTLGAMVGVGAYIRKAHPNLGRWASFALGSIILEVSKVVKKAIRF